MVRRLPWAALAAVLAVALPAAADDASIVGLESDPLSSACELADSVCESSARALPIEFIFIGEGGGGGGQEGNCEAWDIDDGLLDPNGCVRGAVQDLLPPVAVKTQSSTFLGP